MKKLLKALGITTNCGAKFASYDQRTKNSLQL